MAVYTTFADEELRAFLDAYNLGELHSVTGIVEGVTNTNYKLVTATGPYILTLYEPRVAEADLPFFLGLMAHWRQRGIVCPEALTARDGKQLHSLAGRPAALTTFLEGKPAVRPNEAHIAALGQAAATAHRASADFAMSRLNALGWQSWQPFFDQVAHRADEILPGLAAGIAGEIAWLQTVWPDDLPRGAIHADLSPDNVFFIGESLSGIIDFNYACSELYTYELAILLNDWCFELDGQFNITKARALVSSYNTTRPLSEREIATLPILARGASLPYLLTRMYDWFHREAGPLVVKKNPLDYWAKLTFHQGVKSAAEYGLWG